VADTSHERQIPLTIMRTELEITLNGQADTESLRTMGELIPTAPLTSVAPQIQPSILEPGAPFTISDAAPARSPRSDKPTQNRVV